MRLARVALIVVVAFGLTFAGYHIYRRSLPPVPAVVMHDADLAPLLEPSFGARVRHAILGRAADGRVAGPKLIALTFDDGPYPVDTPVLLAVLRAAQVPATFFLIGRDAVQYPGLVRAIAADGNEIANHTETHPNLAALAAPAVTAELTAGAATLARYAADPAIRHEFRPPHGRFREATLAAAQRAGYDTILWTDDPGDWRQVSRTVLAAHIERYATSPEILLLHSGRPETVALLPGIIQRYRRAGYTFTTVADLVRRLGPGPLNHAARTPLPGD
ncbi:MAG TPA: polysaccharide deacetylase family protein [Candidatus Lustribacter sp.]